MPEKFENAALFLRLGLPSTLIRHENGDFLKRSFNWSFISGFISGVDGEHLKTELSENDDVTIIT